MGSSRIEYRLCLWYPALSPRTGKADCRAMNQVPRGTRRGAFTAAGATRTGSHPPREKGLQRSRRQSASAPPRSRPCCASASCAYSEHVGWYAQPPRRNESECSVGERTRRYSAKAAFSALPWSVSARLMIVYRPWGAGGGGVAYSARLTEYAGSPLCKQPPTRAAVQKTASWQPRREDAAPGLRRLEEREARHAPRCECDV
jgi:hypothetical protein